MVEGHVAVICLAVAALALAAAAMGIVGEATKSKAITRTRVTTHPCTMSNRRLTDLAVVQSFVRYDGASCVYRRTPAFGCGVAAASSLLTGQVVLTAAAGCWGRCRTRPDGRRAAVVCSSLLSWFLAVLAASAFLVGALRNQSGERRPREGIASTYYRCTVLVAGVFAGGSFLAVAAAVVGIASYVALEAVAGSGPPRPRAPP
uniref:CASP-like protein n=2 Tax=Setaria italica TaxID=4555 RepID=K3ZC74_SETIT